MSNKEEKQNTSIFVQWVTWIHNNMIRPTIMGMFNGAGGLLGLSLIRYFLLSKLTKFYNYPIDFVNKSVTW